MKRVTPTAGSSKSDVSQGVVGGLRYKAIRFVFLWAILGA